jgi:hypothetical protein
VEILEEKTDSRLSQVMFAAEESFSLGEESEWWWGELGESISIPSLSASSS